MAQIAFALRHISISWDEKRDREICGIAASLRSRMELWSRGQIRLNNLAIQVPGRMPGDWHHHCKASEKW